MVSTLLKGAPPMEYKIVAGLVGGDMNSIAQQCCVYVQGISQVYTWEIDHWFLISGAIPAATLNSPS